MYTTPSSAPPDTPVNASGSPPVIAGLTDGLGDRVVMVDARTQAPVELLRFRREFSDAPGFEEALRERVDDLSSFAHPNVATVIGVQVLDGGDGLALVSAATQGRRLSEMVHVARGAPFATDLVRQVAPVLAALHQARPGVAHGTLSADRIVVTRDGRLVVVEHVLASAFETLRLPANRLRAALGIAVPAGPGPFGLNPRSDLVQLGFLALSLLVGRRLDPAHYPANIGPLFDEFAALDAGAAARLRPWLERALQIGDRPFTSAQEALDALAQPAGRPAPAPVPAADPAPAPAAAAPPVADDPAPSPVRLRDEAPVTDETPEPAIRLQPVESRRADPPAIPAVAAPRDTRGRSAVMWILAVPAALIVMAGFVFFSDLFSRDGTTTETRPNAAAASDAPVAAPRADQPQAVEPIAVLPSAPAALDGAGLSRAGEPAPPAGTTSATAAGPAGDVAPPPRERGVPAGGFGGVRIASPIELQVFENGALIGSTAGPIAMMDGSHVLELVNEPLGFRVRSTVTVRAGQLTPVAINVPNGRLSINAVPWADVFIDGRPAGQTPLANVAVPIGSHEIVFRHPEFGEQKQTVLVKADGLTRVSATFQQAPENEVRR